MIEAQTELTIERQPEELAALWADGRNDARWNPDARRVDMLTPEPVGAGSRFRGEFKGVGTVTWSSVEFDPARRVVNHGSAKFYRFVSTLTFAPSDGGTRVTGRMQVEPLGLFKLIRPLVEPMMRKKFLTLLEQFKQWAEEPTTSRSD